MKMKERDMSKEKGQKARIEGGRDEGQKIVRHSVRNVTPRSDGRKKVFLIERRKEKW